MPSPRPPKDLKDVLRDMQRRVRIVEKPRRTEIDLGLGAVAIHPAAEPVTLGVRGPGEVTASVGEAMLPGGPTRTRDWWVVEDTGGGWVDVWDAHVPTGSSRVTVYARGDAGAALRLLADEEPLGDLTTPVRGGDVMWVEAWPPAARRVRVQARTHAREGRVFVLGARAS